MTKIDNNLVYLRAENARMSLKDMSRHLKQSSQRIKYAITVLKREGIIEHPHCIFDYSYFGLILFRVYFRGAYVRESEQRTYY